MGSLQDIEKSTKEYIIGADEVGYGCLAGPLVIAAVRAPKDWNLEGLGDSKKLSEKRRDAMTVKLKELIKKGDITWHLAEKSSADIDAVGVALALKSCYVECFHALYQPDSLIVTDGIMKFNEMGVDSYDKINLVKADAQVPTVMAASILAKTYRDSIMRAYHKAYPMYSWDSNVGYGSSTHLKAIMEHGPSMLHRFSYAPMRNMDKPNLVLPNIPEQ